MTVESIKSERRFLLIAILSITLFGILMIYESSSVYAFRTTSDAAYFFKRQLLFFIVGLVLFLATLLIDLDLFKRRNKELLLATFFCLIVVVIFGRKIGGAKRWLHIAGFNIQPSEVLKISLLLYCADYFRRKKNFNQKH